MWKLTELRTARRLSTTHSTTGQVTLAAALHCLIGVCGRTHCPIPPYQGAVTTLSALVRRCIASADTTATMRGFPGDSGSSLMEAAHPPNEGSTWNVSCVTVDTLEARTQVDLCSATLIKMDIEGAEVLVLPQLFARLQRCSGSMPPLWLSLHKGTWTANEATRARALVDLLVETYPFVYDATLQRAKPRSAESQATPLADLWAGTAMLLAHDDVSHAAWRIGNFHVDRQRRGGIRQV